MCSAAKHWQATHHAAAPARRAAFQLTQPGQGLLQFSYLAVQLAILLRHVHEARAQVRQCGHGQTSD